jgi:PAS domain S-box-containing protein
MWVILSAITCAITLLLTIMWGVGLCAPDVPLIAASLSALFGGSWWLSHRGYCCHTRYVPPAALLLLSLIETYVHGISTLNTMAYAIVILLAAMFLDRKAQWSMLALSIAAIVSVGWLRPHLRTEDFVYRAAILGLFLSTFGVLLRFFTAQFQHALDALGKSEAQYRTIVETSPDAIVLTDMDGRILTGNQKFAEIHGYDSLEEMQAQGLTSISLTAERERERLLEDLSQVREKGTISNDEYEMLRQDGTSFPMEIAASMLHDPSGKPGSILAVGRDITERKRLEAQFRQAQKMEAVGRLAGGVAHDFNNLLTVIHGYTAIIHGDLASDAPLNRAARRSMLADLSEVARAATRAATLVDQILAFSRRQVMRPMVLDLNELVQDAEKMLRRLIGEDIDLRTILTPSLGKVKADPAQIEQVIMNLAVNARDAMPCGGQLTLETANVDLDEDYVRTHPVSQPGPYVMFAMSDTGFGMDEQVLSHLFEPFFTTKDVGKGTGLGLAMVYGIVKQSGGYIWPYSEPGFGTTFKIYLPRVATEPEVIELKQASESLPRGNATILLVEDEAMVRGVAHHVLERQGYTVLTAGHPGEALPLSNQYGGPIDLLITDVVMPGMGGRDLAERMTSSYPEMQILYMSGYTDDTIVHHGVLEPGVNFLQKPFSPTSLVRKVRDVLEN